MKSPDRGEVWLVDLGMIAKIRPCLVLSIPVLDVDRALTTVLPHTTSTRGSRFEIDVQASFLRSGAEKWSRLGKTSDTRVDFAG